MSEPTENDIEWWDDFYPEGWRDIVHRLYASIEAVSPGHKILQIKEKFGGLRYYVAVDNYADVEALIRDAEAESFMTCEDCGQPCTVTENGWISTLCDEHNPMKDKHYD